MPTYKCNNCTHEYSYKPRECEVCGGNRILIIDKGDQLMAIDKDLFSSYNFRTTIQNYCRQQLLILKIQSKKLKISIMTFVSKIFLF
jgi:DNA polymerase II large subunit